MYARNLVFLCEIDRNFFELSELLTFTRTLRKVLFVHLVAALALQWPCIPKIPGSHRVYYKIEF